MIIGKQKRGAVVLAASLALAGCATHQREASALRFTYTTEGGRPLGLVRAFDDGQRTALQFLTDPPSNLAVFDGQGNQLPIERFGQTILLQGLHAPLRVQIGGDVALVVSTRPTRLQPAQPAQSVTPLPTQLQPVQPAAQLVIPAAAQARAHNSVSEVSIAARSTAKVEPALPSSFSVGFASGRAQFFPSPSLVAALSAPGKAGRFVIRAYTDSSVHTPGNQAVAIARGMEARAYLINRGVDPKAIRVFYHSAGNFVADNRTAEGRARNRRVEIDFQKSVMLAQY